MAIGTSPSRAKSQDKVAPITLKIEGRAIDPTVGNKVTEAVVKKSRLLPGSAFVLVADPTQSLITGQLAKLGQTLEISTGSPASTATKPIFDGVITALQPEFRRDGVFVGIRAYDRSHPMTKGLHTRTYQNVKASDVVSQLVSSYRLQPRVGATSTVYDYLMQGQESDFDFIWRLARREGFSFFVEGKSAHFEKVETRLGEGPWFAYGPQGATPGHQLFSFSPKLSSSNLPEFVTASFRSRGVEFKAEVSLSSGKVTLTEGDGIRRFQKVEGQFDAANKLHLTGVVAGSQAELTKVAEAARDNALASAIEADGLVEGHPDIRPGITLDIRGLTPGYNGKYLVSGCTHTYRGASGYTTRFVSSVRALTLLEAVNGGPARSSATGLSDHLIRGVVTNNNDPDKRGRVRVALPTTMTDQGPAESWWAPVLTGNGGKDRGIQMIPQAGDEVMVGFENGDTRRPFVIGSMWEGKELPGKELSNRDGTFAVQSDKRVVVNAKEDFQMATDKAWTGKAAKAITFESVQDSFTIKAGKEILLSAPTIKLEGSMKVEIKSPQISVKGDAQLELKAPAITIGGGSVKLG